ncbi:MAG: hypothetical protein M5U26_27605 [Planctomycetota bacterium]|nr:hypothetical protein [Planctomycetota bacterium]
MAIHVTHSGSAADVVSPDSLAGRALWGGAYWYFGSTAEPFLTSFQPPSYYGPRIAKGTPFASAFRLRTAQNFWLPWRLMIVGDALCCLRTKEAKRKEYKLEAQPLVRAGERLLTPGGPVTLPPKGDLAAWQAALRLARWCGDRPISSLLSEPPAPALADGPSLGLLLSECVRTYAGTGIVQPGEGGIQLARKHWLAAKPEAQADYAARVYARQALGHLADLALAAKDCAALQERLAELLTAAPSGPLVNRFVEKLEALAKELKKDAEFEAWLAARARDEAAGAFKDVFERQLADRRFAALLAKEQWSGEERAEALKHFVETVKRERRADAVARELRKFHDAVAAKAPAAAGEPLLKELAAVFDPESKEGKRLGEALLAFEKERGYFKHWLFLGPFQDEKAGAWETVAKDGRPDFAATYKDGERDVAWRTLFKPADFGPIDLAKALSPNVNAYVYAAALVKVEKEVAGRLLLGSDDGIVVWIDGQEVHRHEIERGLTPDEDKVQVALKAGEHLVVVRVNQGEGGWGFSARLAGEDDRALPGVVWMCPQPKAEK